MGAHNGGRELEQLEVGQPFLSNMVWVVSQLGLVWASSKHGSLQAVSRQLVASRVSVPTSKVEAVVPCMTHS